MIARTYRWVMFFDVISKAHCPNGHPLPMMDAWGDHDLICHHKGPNGRDDCGRRVYLAPMLRYRGKPYIVAFEVSAEEMKEMGKLKDADSILTFLGLKDNSEAA